MKSLLAVVVLLFAVSADAAPKALLCTKNVPSQTCDTERQILGELQPLYVASDVQFVIADRDSYAVELARVSEMKKAKILATSPTNDAAFQREFNGVFRELEDSILIEYSEDNHFVASVYLNARSMETIKGFETKNGKSVPEYIEGSYDANSATYLNCVSLGFIRGFWERGTVR